MFVLALRLAIKQKTTVTFVIVTASSSEEWTLEIFFFPFFSGKVMIPLPPKKKVRGGGERKEGSRGETEERRAGRRGRGRAPRRNT